MFFITIYKGSRKVEINRNYVSEYNLYLYFLIEQHLLVSSEKMLMSAERNGCVRWLIHFLDLLWVRYKCAKFHHCRICVTYFREGGGLFGPPPIRKQPWKSPSWIGLKSDSFCWLTVLLSDYTVYKSFYLRILLSFLMDWVKK